LGYWSLSSPVVVDRQPCEFFPQERDALAASHTEFISAMEAKCSDLSARCKDYADKYASVKEQVQGLKAELFDARTKLERRDYDYGKLEAKEAESKAKLDELEAKLRQKIDDVGGVKAMMQVGS
jgi:chromosome segregation ATPase